jgi:hypothetical protein
VLGSYNAKENAGQPIENKHFREILQFRAPMISKTCAPIAKPLVSFSETISFDSAGFGLEGRVKEVSFGARPKKKKAAPRR